MTTEFAPPPLESMDGSPPELKYPFIPMRLDKFLVRSTHFSHVDVKTMWREKRIVYVPDATSDVVQKVCTRLLQKHVC